MVYTLTIIRNPRNSIGNYYRRCIIRTALLHSPTVVGLQFSIDVGSTGNGGGKSSMQERFGLVVLLPVCVVMAHL